MPKWATKRPKRIANGSLFETKKVVCKKVCLLFQFAGSVPMLSWTMSAMMLEIAGEENVFVIHTFQDSSAKLPVSL